MKDEERQEIYELVEQAKEDKQIAFTKLYNKFRGLIYKTIYDIVHNKDLAEDLLSVTFTKAFLKIKSYTRHISFEMWLKTIAINSSIDYIRRMKDEKYDYELDNEDNFMQVRDSADLTPEDVYIFNETYSNLNNALDKLNPKYRQIIELRSIQELSYKEISEQLGITESQVKTRIFNAREKLKKMLN